MRNMVVRSLARSSQTMPPPADAPRRSLTDSPWFWIGMFCAVGAILLVIFSQRIDERQAQIERQYQARQLAGQAVAEPGGTELQSPAEGTIIRLQPLLWTLMFGLLVAWAAVFRRRISKRRGV